MDTTFYIVLVILLTLIIYNCNYTEIENMTNDEAIANIASIYNSSTLATTDITSTGSITTTRLSIGPVPPTTVNPGYPLYVNSTFRTIPKATLNDPNYGIGNNVYYANASYQTYLLANGAIWSGGTIINNSALVQGFTESSSIACSAFFSGPIVTPCLLTISDERTKININSADHIDKIKEIDVYSYDMKETGKKIKYGLVAQQLEKIIPDAVNTVTGFIPNIMTIYNIFFENNFICCKLTKTDTNKIEKGDIIKIMYDTEIIEMEILNKEDDKIYFNKFNKINMEKNNIIYLIGKQVNDFKTVDIATLVSLSIANINKQNNIIIEQQKEINILKEKHDELDKKYDELNKIVQKLNQK